MIPAIARAEAENADPKALVNTILTALILANAALCLLGILGAEWVVTLFAPTWVDEPEKFALTVSLTRWMFPLVPLRLDTVRKLRKW